MSNTLSREPRRNRQFWIDHVERWRRSGLSKATYCMQEDIKPGSFYNWSSKINSSSAADIPLAMDTQEQHEPAPIEFQAITVTSAEPAGARSIHVKRADTDVTLPTDLTPEQIDRWLSTIHRLHV